MAGNNLLLAKILKDSNATNGGDNALAEQYPQIYGALQGFMGVSPDEVGGSVLDGSHQAQSAGAGIGFPAGLLAQLSPLARFTKGMPVGLSVKAVDGLPLGAAKKSKASLDAKVLLANEAQGGPSASGLLGYDPIKMRTQYPDVPAPVNNVDKKTGKEFLGKGTSDEMKAVEKVRKAAQKEIDAGNYSPYFDVNSRYYADPANHPLSGNTLTDAVAKTQPTIDKWRTTFDTPDVRNTLQTAFDVGNKDPNAQRWYAMGQLEDEFIKHYGPVVGPKEYDKAFPQAMAATTGGSDPTANLLAANYGNFMHQQGLPVPTRSFEMPYPIGGRYISGNMEMYNKVFDQGIPLTASGQPKRHNFAANFNGHTGPQTIDEQMMTGFDPSGKLMAPPQGSYGVIESIANDLAAANGVPGSEFQDVVWKGLKGVPGKPMIQHVNEAIERTSRVTGLTPEEVVKRSLVERTSPLFGGAGLGLLGYDQQDTSAP